MNIVEMSIVGFKRFEEFTIKFNDGWTVIVGENEVGKSTIIEALDIVLNRRIFNKEDIALSKYFNKKVVENFYVTGLEKDLPKISISVHLYLDENNITGLNFSGLGYIGSSREEKCGISFEFAFDEDFKNDINIKEYAENRVIPIEYYKASWTTFSGKSYKPQMLPMKCIFLDTTQNKNDLYSNYAKKIYKDKIDVEKRRTISSGFNKIISKFQKEYKSELEIQEDKNIGLDTNKMDISKLVDIYENNISVQSMGKGKENIIKTEIALSDNIFDVVCIEEPESHLSHSNARILLDCIKKSTNEQLILTSHSSLIVSRLNIKNIVWINDSQASSLSSLDYKIGRYFQKIDNLDILKFILSNKVILVEGAAEYIILPSIFEKIFKQTLDECGIEIISMGSVSYENYRGVSDVLGNKKVVVITDNDKKIDKTEVDEKFAVFCDSSLDNWTLEAAFYNNNVKYFDELYKNKKTESEYKGEEYPKALAHMLKNKTENALWIEENCSDLTIPEYIKDALEWIRR